MDLANCKFTLKDGTIHLGLVECIRYLVKIEVDKQVGKPGKISRDVLPPDMLKGGG